MEYNSILFKNTNVLVRNETGYELIRNAFLGVRGKYIDYLGISNPPDSYDLEKDYRNRLLMPGLVNAHTHIAMVILRGIGSGLPLDRWLNDVIFPSEARMTSEEIRAASYYAMLELIASGTTSFTDMYFFPEETVEAVGEAGLKANLNKYITSFGEDISIEDSLIYPSLDFIKKYNHSYDDRIRTDFSIHAEYTNKPHIVKEYSRLCKEYGGRMHIHLSETKSEVEACLTRYGMSPVKWFESLGTFDSPTCAAHVVWPIDDDLDILKKHNVSIMHCPTSNLLLGSGFAPVSKMLRMGINLGLGTDGTASNNNLNMFEEMHIGLIARNGFKLDANAISSEKIIDMATINGARLQGRDDTGEIKIGKSADIIALNLDNIHMYPLFDAPAIITKSAQASDVCLNMVNGRILYEDGNFLTLDKEKIVREFKEKCENFHKQKS